MPEYIKMVCVTTQVRTDTQRGPLPEGPAGGKPEAVEREGGEHATE